MLIIMSFIGDLDLKQIEKQLKGINYNDGIQGLNEVTIVHLIQMH